MAKIVTKKKSTSDKAAEQKMEKVQKQQLQDNDEGENEEQDKEREEDNKRGAAIVKKHKIKSFGAARKEEEDETDDVVAESRPKTAGDQQRILGRDSNPEHMTLVNSAKTKMAAMDKGEETDELTDDEITAYLEEEKKNLKHYGAVKLTPRSLNTKRPAIAKASQGAGAADEGDLIKVTMFETIDPAPQVGPVNVVRDHGYEKLVKGETYLLPKNVAMVLAEGKKGAIHD